MNGEKPSKLDMENKIKAMHNFRTAVRAGTFPGHATVHIAALLNLLDNEHDSAASDYEAESLKHPEWGRPKDMPQPVGAKA